MLAESNVNTKAAREKAVELLFEKYNVPGAERARRGGGGGGGVHGGVCAWMCDGRGVGRGGARASASTAGLPAERRRPHPARFAAVFMAKSAVLSSFASGRQTSLVVDAGHDGTVGERCVCGVAGGRTGGGRARRVDAHARGVCLHPAVCLGWSVGQSGELQPARAWWGHIECGVCSWWVWVGAAQPPSQPWATMHARRAASRGGGGARGSGTRHSCCCRAPPLAAAPARAAGLRSAASQSQS